MAKAEGTFNLDRFDAEDPYDDHDGVKLSRAHISKTFSGDLVGTSETDLITVTAENPAAYVAIERFDGTVHGRKGSFILQHEAGGTGGVPWMTWKIVESTGTGELAGLRGEGQIIIAPDGAHSYVIDYEL
ncbi:MAG TPA: DUF3224 domain-containing protein [Streptosporangiaceae bacterium]|nr:DUF3224 domain-containing protein [Streptosporangiaceae bacterium]